MQRVFRYYVMDIFKSIDFKPWHDLSKILKDRLDRNKFQWVNERERKPKDWNEQYYINGTKHKYTRTHTYT